MRLGSNQKLCVRCCNHDLESVWNPAKINVFIELLAARWLDSDSLWLHYERLWAHMVQHSCQITAQLLDTDDRLFELERSLEKPSATQTLLPSQLAAWSERWAIVLQV